MENDSRSRLQSLIDERYDRSASELTVEIITEPIKIDEAQNIWQVSTPEAFATNERISITEESSPEFELIIADQIGLRGINIENAKPGDIINLPPTRFPNGFEAWGGANLRIQKIGDDRGGFIVRPVRLDEIFKKLAFRIRGALNKVDFNDLKKDLDCKFLEKTEEGVKLINCEFDKTIYENDECKFTMEGSFSTDLEIDYEFSLENRKIGLSGKLIEDAKVSAKVSAAGEIPLTSKILCNEIKFRLIPINTSLGIFWVWGQVEIEVGAEANAKGELSVELKQNAAYGKKITYTYKDGKLESTLKDLDEPKFKFDPPSFDPDFEAHAKGYIGVKLTLSLSSHDTISAWIKPKAYLEAEIKDEPIQGTLYFGVEADAGAQIFKWKPESDESFEILEKQKLLSITKQQVGV